MTPAMALPTENQTLMFNEAAEAADVIERQFARNAATVAALAAELRAAPPPFVVTCARGSSDHAATYAKYLFETRIGIVTASASPSVGSVYEAPLALRGALYLVISQSGKSPDLLRNAQAAKAAGARVVALVNVEDSPLAELADTVLPLCAGPEKSVAATKSYLASLAAILQLGAAWHGDAALVATLAGLPAALRHRWIGGRAQPVRARPRPRSGGGAGSRVEVQGNLRPACRGLQFGRGEARADGLGRPGLPGAGLRPAG